jgi:hypothetical protein
MTARQVPSTQSPTAEQFPEHNTDGQLQPGLPHPATLLQVPAAACPVLLFCCKEMPPAQAPCDAVRLARSGLGPSSDNVRTFITRGSSTLVW